MSDNKFDMGYLYKDSFSEKEFLDAVLKTIMDDYTAPSYIFDEMVCSKIGRINIPLILTDGDAEIEYSRMIGYDRYVTTTKYKTTTYSNGFSNRTQSSSTRTVTDWQRDSGTLTGTAKSGTYDERYKVYDEYVTNHVMDKNNIRQLSDEELSKYTLTDDMVEFMKNDILNKVYANNITYPGHHVKNEEYYGTTTLYNTTVTIVSLYAITIAIRDQEITFIASSNGDIEIKMFGDYPADDFDELFKFRERVTGERLEATKSQRKIFKCTILTTILSFILFLALGLALKILALTIISFVVLVLGLIVGIKFSNDIKRISKPYYQEIFERSKRDSENKQRIKEESYESYIRKLNN